MQTLSFQVGRVTEWVDEYEKCRESQSPDLSLIPMSILGSEFHSFFHSTSLHREQKVLTKKMHFPPKFSGRWLVTLYMQAGM